MGLQRLKAVVEDAGSDSDQRVQALTFHSRLIRHLKKEGSKFFAQSSLASDPDSGMVRIRGEDIHPAYAGLDVHLHASHSTTTPEHMRNWGGYYQQPSAPHPSNPAQSRHLISIHQAYDQNVPQIHRKQYARYHGEEGRNDQRVDPEHHIAMVMQGKRELVTHEYTHYLDRKRAKSGGWMGSSGLGGATPAYFNHPAEFNAYYQQGAAELQRWTRPRLGNRGGDPQSARKEMVGHGFSHFHNTYLKNRLRPDFQNALDDKNKRKLMKRSYGMFKHLGGE